MTKIAIHCQEDKYRLTAVTPCENCRQYTDLFLLIPVTASITSVTMATAVDYGNSCGPVATAVDCGNSCGLWLQLWTVATAVDYGYSCGLNCCLFFVIEGVIQFKITINLFTCFNPTVLVVHIWRCVTLYSRRTWQATRNTTHHSNMNNSSMQI